MLNTSHHQNTGSRCRPSSHAAFATANAQYDGIYILKTLTKGNTAIQEILKQLKCITMLMILTIVEDFQRSEHVECKIFSIGIAIEIQAVDLFVVPPLVKRRRRLVIFQTF